ncbi:hypothetical protein ACIPJG_08755 [Streptomyces halstedii]|uniref:hypothetical protein n=1 Tax=Streptomyces halstedii TaxID=1944 RepID=UPI003806BCC6
MATDDVRALMSAPGNDRLIWNTLLSEERGLADRVFFHEVPAAVYARDGYDLAVSIGAAHAWPGGAAEALKALRAAVRPGGRVLFGDGFWEREPSPAALEGLGAGPGDFGSLLELIRLAESAANIGRGERWALAHPGHPPHAEVTAAVDARRTGYYGGYRGTLGLAYLVLGT